MQLINDLFFVKEIDMIPLDPNNPEIKIKNKIFSKISRISACSKNSLIEIILDINTEIYPICSKDELEILILKTQEFNCQNPKNSYDWSIYFGKELLDSYEYVIYGTIFHSGLEENNFFVYASFGGLLMKLFGVLKNNKLEDFKIDSKILLLIRKL